MTDRKKVLNTKKEFKKINIHKQQISKTRNTFKAVKGYSECIEASELIF